MEKQNRINELVLMLNQANYTYYQNNEEVMSNHEYDRLYDELLQLEIQTGYSPSNSPTHQVGYDVVGGLTKVRHEYSALSLDKTKSREKLMQWLGNKDGVLSWKLDGLTIQVTYNRGLMSMAATRGNGEIGEDITHNAIHFKGLPRKIPFNGHLVVRGEALITYRSFDCINQGLEPEVQYKNPRNLASGSVRQLDSKQAAARGVEFRAFQCVASEDKPFAYNSESLEWLKSLGFSVVDYLKIDATCLLAGLDSMEAAVSSNDYPSDGLVLAYDDIAYGDSLGTTGKFPRHSIAFKWQDDAINTTLKEVAWQASRTGLINPVAIFEPVELEGTTVTRATAVNVSTVEKLQLSAGSIISVYKANKIIPNIAENIRPCGEVIIPTHCPLCEEKTQVRKSMNNHQLVKTLHCPNNECYAKYVGRFVHFASRDGMNIVGMSESTIEKFVDMGYIKEFEDFYSLEDFKEAIIAMEGFGEKSFRKMIDAIEKSRKVKFPNFLYALGIPNVGLGTSKNISKVLGGSIDEFKRRLYADIGFDDAEDVGEVINQSLEEWYRVEASAMMRLLNEIEVEAEEKVEIVLDSRISGKGFVVTGSLQHYANREALVKEIEKLGGKVLSSVSKKTDYLINNDSASNSSKNIKAGKLGIKIITEEEFLKMIE